MTRQRVSSYQNCMQLYHLYVSALRKFCCIITAYKGEVGPPGVKIIDLGPVVQN